MRLFVLGMLLALQSAKASDNKTNIFAKDSDDTRSDTTLTHQKDSTAAARFREPDAGSWFGLRTGLFTNGGPVSERWLFGVAYEYRTSGVVSFPIEGFVMRHRESSFTHNISLLAASLKVRMRVLESIRLYVQGGIGASPDIIRLSLLSGAGIEWLSEGRVAVGFGVHRADVFDGPHVLAHASVGI